MEIKETEQERQRWTVLRSCPQSWHLSQCLWSPPVCVLVHQAPRWVSGTSGGRGDACGGSRACRGRSAPCPWSCDGDGGDGGDDGPWSGRGPARAP